MLPMSNNNFTNLVHLKELTASGDRDRSKLVRDTIIADNMNLIRSIAHKFRKASSHLQVEDLINEGVLGMMVAIDRYNPDRGFEFSTYATWWIRRDIMRALSSTSRTIRVPERIASKLPRLRRAQVEFVATFGFEPDLISLAQGLGMTAADAKAAHSVMYAPASLVNENGESIDIESDATPIDEQVEARLRNQALRKVMESTLKADEITVLSMRYGMGDDDKIHTLTEVGTVLGVSREWVRQMEIEAIKALRAVMPNSEDYL